MIDLDGPDDSWLFGHVPPREWPAVARASGILVDRRQPAPSSFPDATQSGGGAPRGSRRRR